MDENIDKAKEFMEKQKVSFDQMIRCFNFWESLSLKERNQFIENYNNGDYSKCGWY